MTQTKAQPLSRLEQLEKVVEAGLDHFVSVGAALKEIHDQGLYRDQYGSWEVYCRDRWGFSRRRGYQLIAAVDVSTAVHMNLPERQARTIANQPPDVQRQAIANAQAKGPVTGPSLEQELAAINDEEEERIRNTPPADRTPRKASGSGSPERVEQIRRLCARLRRLHAGLVDVADEADAALDAYLRVVSGTAEQ